MANRVAARVAGLACTVGGTSWFLLALLDVSGWERWWGNTVGGLLFAFTNLCLMGGPLGLRALRAAGRGWTGWLGSAGTAITLLGLLSYVSGVAYATGLAYADGGADPETSGLVPASRAAGALLAGAGMLLLGVAVLAARKLTDWRSAAPLLVGLYYAVMIPIQVVYFIVPTGRPSTALLAFWGVAWALLGYALVSHRPGGLA